MLRLFSRQLFTSFQREFVISPACRLHEATTIMGDKEVERRNASNRHDNPNKNAGRLISDILEETKRKDRRREQSSRQTGETKQVSNQRSKSEENDEAEQREDHERDVAQNASDEKKNLPKQDESKETKKDKQASEMFSCGTS